MQQWKGQQRENIPTRQKYTSTKKTTATPLANPMHLYDTVQSHIHRFSD
jgi:hypothetical protein